MKDANSKRRTHHWVNGRFVPVDDSNQAEGTGVELGGEAGHVREPEHKAWTCTKRAMMVVGFGATGLLLLAMCADPDEQDPLAPITEPSDAFSEAAKEPRTAVAPASLSADWLTGSWVLTPEGGEDGKTRCADFNAGPIYRLNRETAKIMTFGPDGEYRSLFAYTTPSGEEHYQVERAQWRIGGSGVDFAQLSVEQTPFGGEAENVSVPANILGSNVVEMDGNRFVRCEGNTDEMYGE